MILIRVVIIRAVRYLEAPKMPVVDVSCMHSMVDRSCLL